MLLSDLATRLSPEDAKYFDKFVEKFSAFQLRPEALGFDKTMCEIIRESYESYVGDLWSWIESILDDTQDYQDIELGYLSQDDVTTAIVALLEDAFA